MKRHKKLIIILTILIILGLVGVYFLIARSQTSAPGERSLLNQLLPFGGTGGNTTTPTTTIKNENGGGATIEGGGVLVDQNTTTDSIPINQAAIKLSKGPVAGFMVSGNIVLYVDRGTGHIYQEDLVTGEIVPISNTTIPKVLRAIWIDGNTVAFQQINDSENLTTFIASINRATQSITGTFLPENVDSITTYGGKLLYVKDTSVFLFDKTSEKSSRVATLPIGGWTLSWNSENPEITTKSSGVTVGYSYILNLKTGALTKQAGNIVGLTANQQPSQTLFGGSSRSNITLYNISNNTTSRISVSTLPEKCVELQKNHDQFICGVVQNIPSGTYPDDWYKGIVSFTDDLETVSILNETSQSTVSLSGVAGTDIDVINPKLTTDDKGVVLMNKKDYSLWYVTLENTSDSDLNINTSVEAPTPAI